MSPLWPGLSLPLVFVFIYLFIYLMEGDLRTSGFHSFLATHVATSDAFVRIYWFGGEFGVEM